MISFLLIQFGAWVVLLIGLAIHDDEDSSLIWKDTLNRFNLIKFGPIFDWVDKRPLKHIWVLIFAVTVYTLLLPFSIWMWLNMQPFKFIGWVYSGRFIHGKLAFIFKDTNK